MRCVRSAGATGGINYGGKTNACPPKPSRRLGKKDDGFDTESRQKKAKKSLNAGSSKKRLSKKRIVKIQEPSLIERLKEKKNRKKKTQDKYTSPRFL